MTETTVTQVPFDEATEAQLRHFALTYLGITIHPAAKIETVQAKVREAWPKDTIMVSQGGPPPMTESQAPPSSKPFVPLEERSHFICRINIENTPDGRDPVPLGCNGSVILVPRGNWCEVPIKYLDSLRHAIRTEYDTNEDGSLGESRDVMQYQHEIWQGMDDPREGVLRPEETRGRVNPSDAQAA